MVADFQIILKSFLEEEDILFRHRLNNYVNNNV